MRTARFCAITQRVYNSLPTFRDNLSGSIFYSQEYKILCCMDYILCARHGNLVLDLFPPYPNNSAYCRAVARKGRRAKVVAICTST